MITLVTHTVEPLTRQHAERVANMKRWRGDRELDEGRVEFLINKIRNNLFFPPSWAFAKLNGTLFRINGQHSATALALCEKFPAKLTVSQMLFKVDNEADLALLYGQFDAMASSRKMRDILQAKLATCDAADSLPCATAVQIILCGVAVATDKINCDDAPNVRAAMIDGNKDFIKFASKFVNIDHLGIAAVMAAMYKTWLKDREAAAVFWKQVATENHWDPAHPTRALARFLVTRTQQTAVAKPWRRRAILAKCIHAWNAARNGKTSLLKYVPGKPIPEPI